MSVVLRKAKGFENVVSGLVAVGQRIDILRPDARSRPPH